MPAWCSALDWSINHVMTFDNFGGDVKSIPLLDVLIVLDFTPKDLVPSSHQIISRIPNGREIAPLSIDINWHQ